MNQRGFTLLEVLFYILLWGMLMGGALEAAQRLSFSRYHDEGGSSIQHDGVFVMEKIGWALHDVARVIEPAPGTLGSRLSLITINGDHVVVCRYAQAVRLFVGSDTPPTCDDASFHNLTSSHTAAQELSFALNTQGNTLEASTTLSDTTFSTTRFIYTTP